MHWRDNLEKWWYVFYKFIAIGLTATLIFYLVIYLLIFLYKPFI